MHGFRSSPRASRDEILALNEFSAQQKSENIYADYNVLEPFLWLELETVPLLLFRHFQAITYKAALCRDLLVGSVL